MSFLDRRATGDGKNHPGTPLSLPKAFAETTRDLLSVSAASDTLQPPQRQNTSPGSSAISARPQASPWDLPPFWGSEKINPSNPLPFPISIFSERACPAPPTLPPLTFYQCTTYPLANPCPKLIIQHKSHCKNTEISSLRIRSRGFA